MITSDITAAKTQQGMTGKTKFALVLTIFLWASAFVGIRAGLQTYSPEGLALLRYLVASVCMGAIYWYSPYRGRSKMSLVDKCALMLVGVIGVGIYNITLNYGELTVSSGISSFITSQAPIVTTLLAAFFLGERIHLLHGFGLVVSIFGVLLMALGESNGHHLDRGIYYLLVTTLTAGFFSAFQKPYLKKYHALEATTYIIWGATLFLLFFFPYLRSDLAHASLANTLVVIYLGIFPAAIAYLAWGYVLSKISVSQAVSFLYFMPFVATLLAWIWLKEVPVMLSLLGGLLAIAGVWLVNYACKLKVMGRTRAGEPVPKNA